ncbi:MAG: hypothetical protein AB1349_13780 [Elusimicrobiota bacterium]
MKQYNIFVAMPFGEDPKNPNNEWTKLYQGGIKPVEDEERTLSLNIYRADYTLKDLGLKEHSMKCIEDADVLLCVLTDNPNVFWEVGYTECLEKPIIFMVDSQRLKEKKIPVLAGQLHFCEYNHNLVKEAPASLDECKNILKVIREQLGPYIRKAVEYVGHRKVGKNVYKINVYNNRKVVNLDRLISSAKDRVDILETNLEWFAYIEPFNLENIENHPLKKAIDNGAEIRILTMDPEAIIAEYRAKQLGKVADVPGYREVLWESIKKIYTNFRKYKNFNLRIYNELPLQIAFRIDDRIITGIIARGEKSRKLIHIVLC